jgi:hypothetical protein
MSTARAPRDGTSSTVAGRRTTRPAAAAQPARAPGSPRRVRPQRPRVPAEAALLRGWLSAQTQRPASSRPPRCTARGPPSGFHPCCSRCSCSLHHHVERLPAVRGRRRAARATRRRSAGPAVRARPWGRPRRRPRPRRPAELYGQQPECSRSDDRNAVTRFDPGSLAGAGDTGHRFEQRGRAQVLGQHGKQVGRQGEMVAPGTRLGEACLLVGRLAERGVTATTSPAHAAGTEPLPQRWTSHQGLVAPRAHGLDGGLGQPVAGVDLHRDASVGESSASGSKSKTSTRRAGPGRRVYVVDARTSRVQTSPLEMVTPSSTRRRAPSGSRQYNAPRPGAAS